MRELGRKQNLITDRITEHGAYLKAEDAPSEQVLLPKNQLEGEKPGDTVTVFIYKDSEDRLIATKQIPSLELGGLAVLPVVQVNQIGAFLDWDSQRICSFLSANRPVPYRKGTRFSYPFTSTRAAVCAPP